MYCVEVTYPWLTYPPGCAASSRDSAKVTRYWWGLKSCDPRCVGACFSCTDNTYQYECGGAMLRVSDVAPAPSGHEWRFQCSVGVDCSDVEPRCIWLAVLRGISPGTSPRRTPIASPRRPGFRRAIQRHRLSWVGGQILALGCQCWISFLSADYIFLLTRANILPKNVSCHAPKESETSSRSSSDTNSWTQVWSQTNSILLRISGSLKNIIRPDHYHPCECCVVKHLICFLFFWKVETCW